MTATLELDETERRWMKSGEEPSAVLLLIPSSFVSYSVSTLATSYCSLEVNWRVGIVEMRSLVQLLPRLTTCDYGLLHLQLVDDVRKKLTDVYPCCWFTIPGHTTYTQLVIGDRM